jgi:CheY-like chemotaxis protein
MRILIADDHEIIRNSVIRVLQSRTDVEECAEAANGKEAVEKALEWKPDLILLDVRLPLLSGFDPLKRSNSMPLVFLSFFSRSTTLKKYCKKRGGWEMGSY